MNIFTAGQRKRYIEWMSDYLEDNIQYSNNLALIERGEYKTEFWPKNLC